MATAMDMEHYFEGLAAVLQNALGAGERYTASFDAEADRLRADEPRQGAAAGQRRAALPDDPPDRRHAARGTHAVADRRPRRGRPRGRATPSAACAPCCPNSPTTRCCCFRRPCSRAARVRAASLPPSEAVIDEILASAAGLDLVGIYAAGPVWRGFANSEGQRNWHATTAFNLQWSLYHRADKAVKSGHAGFAWDSAAFAQKMDAGARTPCADHAAAARARARQVPRVPRAVGDGGDRRAAVLGRLLGPRTRDEAVARSRRCRTDRRSTRA